MNAIWLAKWAVTLIGPALALLTLSELLGIDSKISADSVFQAVARAFRARSVAGIVASLVSTALMFAMSLYSYRYADRHLTSTEMVRPSNAGAAAQAVLCSADVLSGRRFDGSFAGTDHSIAFTRVTSGADGAVVEYRLLRGGDDLRNDLQGSFDGATCTLTIPELVSRAQIVREGERYRLVALDPLWRLDNYVAQ